MAFKATVKSEPRGAVKGQFQGELSAEGLALTQRKKEITIPVGVDARHAGKNRIDISLADYRLEVFVTKFGTYQDRLANDIAKFLSGGGSQPVVSEYALPWYFYAVSALPIGIPIITLGGAIPGAVGFGLAAACFGISQNEDWSIPVRLFAAGALAAAGYIALIAAMAVAVGTQSP